MKPGHVIFFLRRNLKRRRGRTLTAIGAVAVAVAVFHLAAALALVLRSDVLNKVERIFPERSMIVRARAIELGPLAFSPALLTARITPEIARRLAALPGVESVWPQLPLNMPALATGSLAGYEGSTDIVAYGVPREMVAADVVGRRGFTYSDSPTSPMPVIVSRFFVDMFNLGLAEGQGLPKLTDQAVIGRHFQLVLGASLLAVEVPADRVRKIECEIVGLTDNPSLLGLTAPIEYVREFNRWYQGEQAVENYAQLHLMLRSMEHYDAVAKTVESLGLQVVGQRETARRLRLAINGAALVLVAFGAAILALAAINIVNTFALIMLERRGEIGLLRAVGATRMGAMALLLGESVVLGLSGAAVGSGAAWVAAAALNRALARWLPPFSLAPNRWLDERAGLFFFCVALGLIGSALATAPMVWKAVRRWPADLLRE
ncbi:MAG: FtsX-like permease family protein [Candidatus Sumerlaeia bacterium]|nr:FtsX-like permease family protein [Candidatus Sumerlaeia bacterium]